MSIKLGDIRKGSRVLVMGGFGHEPAQEVTVSDVYDDVKNGRPGIEYQQDSGDHRWAYLTQVVRVVKY
jgi:hypothetical protein